MDKCWSFHRSSRRRRFAFVAQRQDVLLQMSNPLLLDRQRSLKHFLTEPEQQHRGRGVCDWSQLQSTMGSNNCMNWWVAQTRWAQEPGFSIYDVGNMIFCILYFTDWPALEGVDLAHQFDQWCQWGLRQHGRDAAWPRWLLGIVLILFSGRHCMFGRMAPWTDGEKQHPETVFIGFNLVCVHLSSLTPRGVHTRVSAGCGRPCVALWMSGWANGHAQVLSVHPVHRVHQRRLQAAARHRVRVSGQRGWSRRSLRLKDNQRVFS